jgi:hypothetical protein
VSVDPSDEPIGLFRLVSSSPGLAPTRLVVGGLETRTFEGFNALGELNDIVGVPLEAIHLKETCKSVFVPPKRFTGLENSGRAADPDTLCGERKLHCVEAVHFHPRRFERYEFVRSVGPSEHFNDGGGWFTKNVQICTSQEKMVRSCGLRILGVLLRARSGQVRREAMAATR